MAFTMTFKGKTSGTLHKIYNVDWSVGKIGSNIQEDVMLVQALFRIFYYELMGFTDAEFEPPPGEPVIVVDGWIGPATHRHIVHFQRQMVASGRKVLQDGIFDPFRALEQVSTISKTRYALELLNNGCANYCTKNGVDYYTNLPNRTDMPLALRSALKTVKTTANKYKY